MSHVLEYTLSLQDKMSAKLKQIGISSDSALNKFAKLEKQSLASTKLMNEMGKSVHTLSDKLNLLRNERDLIPAKNFRDLAKYNAEIKKTEKEISKLQGTSAHSKVGGMFSGMMGMLGIGAGIYAGGEMIHDGVERAHVLHLAEAQLKNTMQNMGTYSNESFEKVVAGSKKMALNINYSTADIVGLQSQLRLVGTIGEEEMQKMTTASADLATKMNIGIDEAGMLLAKGVNDPEAMTRLTRRIVIDPVLQKQMKELAKNGHEAEARTMLLNIVEGKFGGAAEAAANADPLFRFNKTIAASKLAMGEAAIKIQAALAPALVKLANLFSGIVQVIAPIVVWFTKHKWAAIGLGTAITVLTVALEWNTIVTKLAAAKESLLAFSKIFTTTATNAETAAQWRLNAAMLANPYVIAAVAIAAVGYAIYKVVTKTNTLSSAMNDIAKKTSEYSGEEKAKLDILFDRLKYTNAGSEERIKLAKELKALYPDLLGKMDLENGSLDEIAKGYDKVSKSIDRKARAQAAQEELTAMYKNQVELQRTVNKAAEFQKRIATDLSVGKSLEWNKAYNLQKENFDKLQKEGKIKKGVEFEFKTNDFLTAQNKLKDQNDAMDKIRKDYGVDNIGEGGGTGNTGKAGASPVMENITGGGSKPTNITINLGKLMDHVIIQSTNLKEGAQEMEKVVTEVMLRVLNSGNAVAGR